MADIAFGKARLGRDCYISDVDGPAGDTTSESDDEYADSAEDVAICSICECPEPDEDRLGKYGGRLVCFPCWKAAREQVTAARSV